jgi:regulatory protein YycI of two-component signal transduction system YycFG
VSNNNQNEIIMNWKKMRSFVVVVFFLSFFLSVSLGSCGKKAETEETTEHPAEEKAEHPKADSVQEHPTESDTVKQE